MQCLLKSTSGKGQKFEFHLVHFHPLQVPMWVELPSSCLLTIFKISAKIDKIFKEGEMINQCNYHHLIKRLLTKKSLKMINLTQTQRKCGQTKEIRFFIDLCPQKKENFPPIEPNYNTWPSLSISLSSRNQYKRSQGMKIFLLFTFFHLSATE